MNNILSYPDYRQVIQHALEERCGKNPKYSLRAFARDLGIAPARLSDVLRSRYGLSTVAAIQIGKKLGLNLQEIEYFSDLVDRDHARARKQKMAAIIRLESRAPVFQKLSSDDFQIISDWYHYAILELTGLIDFKCTPRAVANRLGIQLIVAKAAIERLLRLGYLVKTESGLKASEPFTTTTHGVPSEAIRKFHRQVLEKATLAVDLQTVEERDLSSIVMGIDPKDLADAKEEIKKFRRQFNQKFGKSKNKSKVYCLGIQFFNLTSQIKAIKKGTTK